MTKSFRTLLLLALMFLQATSYASFGVKSNSNETSVNPNAIQNIPSVDAVRSAMNELKTISKKEKKDRWKDVKKELKNYKEAKKAGAEPSTDTLLMAILAILLPPLAVYLHEGEINTKFWISLVLTLIFWLPGVIYALLVIFGNA